MTYIYAYSNHKYGLARVRRMAVLYKELQAQEIEVELLTNDHRAANVARELGVESCIAIQTVWDIDSVVQWGDSLIMDTPEDAEEKLAFYVERFLEVSRVANSCDDKSIYGEKILHIDPKVDAIYASEKATPKVERTVLFYGDSDSEKWLGDQRDLFAGLGIELLLGEYFYLGYEDVLESIFPLQHEAEAYKELIVTSSTIVTYVEQTAYEARAAGANVLYLCDMIEACQRELMQALGIVVLEHMDQRGSLMDILQ